MDTPPVEDVMAQSESDPDPSPARREEEEEVLRGREVEASAGGNPELERRKHKSDRKAKALSTGFEHISPAPGNAIAHTLFISTHFLAHLFSGTWSPVICPRHLEAKVFQK